MKCSCASRDLFNFGCKCGAFHFEISDHVWFNGSIYSIGKTADEAEQLSESYLKDFEDFSPDWLLGDWQLISDVDPLPIICDDEDEPETMFAWEWVRYYGPGYLGAI